jgi:hypothetical protein
VVKILIPVFCIRKVSDLNPGSEIDYPEFNISYVLSFSEVNKVSRQTTATSSHIHSISASVSRLIPEDREGSSEQPGPTALMCYITESSDIRTRPFQDPQILQCP